MGPKHGSTVMDADISCDQSALFGCEWSLDGIEGPTQIAPTECNATAEKTIVGYQSFLRLRAEGLPPKINVHDVTELRPEASRKHEKPASRKRPMNEKDRPDNILRHSYESYHLAERDPVRRCGSRARRHHSCRPQRRDCRASGSAGCHCAESARTCWRPGDGASPSVKKQP